MRKPVFVIAVCLALAAVARARTSQASPNVTGASENALSEVTFLELGKPIEREMRGGEKHSYKVHAEAGQFVHVVALQEGIDVAVTLLDPSGKKLMIADSMNGSYGPEPVSIIAEDSGDLQLNVTTFSTDAPPGHYQIQLTDLRAPTARDRLQIKAERTYAEGHQLYLRTNVESARAAAAKWQESFELWKSIDDKYGQALSLNSAGYAFWRAQNTQRALECYYKALDLWRLLGDRASLASTLRNIGVIDHALGENQKALDQFNEALPLLSAIGNHADEARTLNNIGIVNNTLGKRQKALDFFNQALRLQRTIGDRAGEASTLVYIGIIYEELGENQKALDYYNQALPLARAAGDSEGEASALNGFGVAYAALGENQKALDYFNQALTMNRAAGDHMSEATALSNIGAVYRAMGEEQKALDCYNQALPLQRAVGDTPGEASTLGKLGAAYNDLGEIQKALDYENQALLLQRELGNLADEADTLTDMGVIFAGVGDEPKALDYYNQALVLRHTVGDLAGEANTLHNIGSAYADLGEKQEAMDYFNQALPLRRAAGDRAGEASTLHNIGWAYHDSGNNHKALAYYEQALMLLRAVGNRRGEANTLASMGMAYESLGEKQKALDDFNQALPLYRVVKDPMGEGYALVHIMEYWKGLGNPSLAVLFGKQGVDRFQQIRRNIGGLDKEAQQNFLKSKEDYYRELAELLVSAGRLPEAQQVLDLLKAEEYSEFTHHRGAPDSNSNPVALTPLEEKADQEYDQITGQITAIGTEWTQLKSKSPRTADEENRYKELSDRLTAANQRFQAYLKTLYDTFGKGDQANARLETINEQTAGLKTLVGELGAGAVAIYTLVLDEKCVLMVVTPTSRIAHEVPISKLALRGKVFAFAGALAAHASEQDIQAKAQDLYNVLIVPIEEDLQGAQARTLVWSLDDVLRYVPMAGLYDGKQYLVERYKNVVITTASFGNLKDQPQVSNWSGAAMGVSKDYDRLGELKNVPGELASVIRSNKTPGSHGPIPGTILLNESFTETSMETALNQHPPLVHIASHYVFHIGDDTKSYLLLGGKEAGGQGFHLTLADIRDDQEIDFQGIELLTLSGCQTAVGSNDSDGREIDGLGITAQRKGAKAVVATLWAVDDESVGLLMATFYKLWVTTPGITKVEALQQAQLALLHGTADTAVASQDSSVNDASASNVKPRPASHYSNPYYWAPFILIGNWK